MSSVLDKNCKIILSWQNINVEVLEKQKTFWKTVVKKKTILDNVSGVAQNNSLVAILGSSGCGKTTLLSAISGRQRNKTGLTFINNNIIFDEKLRNVSGYVHQQDIFTEYMTVIEHIQFTAALKMTNKNKEKSNTTIKKLLSELSLESQSLTLIKNLSGGERRRLSLAGELISSPLILFCDEPTTGLDSYSAIVVIEKLKAIAFSGKIVITTIHQPSSQLFHYFDTITLLAEGKLIFQGTANEAKEFFDSMNLLCPTSYNPADFYIRCLTEENVDKMCEIFENVKKNPIKIDHCHNHNDLFPEKKIKNNIFRELKWLLWRSYIENIRNKSVRLGGYFCVLFEVLLVSLFYANITITGGNSVQSIQGFISFVASEFTFTNMYSVINVFPAEITVFLREKTLYSSSAYFTSKVLSMVPVTLLSTITYMTIFFSIIKYFNGVYLWFQMTCMAFLVSMTSCGLGLAFSANFPTIEHVELLLGPLEFTLLLFGGLLLKLDSVPVYFSWIKYVSPFYYIFDSFSNLMWKNIDNLGTCENGTIPCFTNGTQVLQTYGVYNTYDALPYDILYLHILLSVFCLIGFVGIVRRKLTSSI